MRLKDLKNAKDSGQNVKKEFPFKNPLVKEKSSPYTVMPMHQSDLAQVLEIIEDHDEDDAEAAEISYTREGFDNQYVLSSGTEVVGMTGFRPAPNTHATAWLSWTYLAEHVQGQNHGKAFVEEIIQKCREAGFRKLYVSTSDYIDEEDGDIYAQARHFYQSLGFVHELSLADYFDEGESKLIYAMTLEDYEPTEPSWSATAGFTCNEVFELLECDDTYSFGIEINEQGHHATLQDIQNYMQQARQQEAERIYIGLPSDAQAFINVLMQAGFSRVGQLTDYYQKGVSEVQFRVDL